MEQKGKLVVVSGFSGAGKGTLMKALLAAHPDRYALSVSYTTRGPRPGEREGVDYYYVTDEKFERMIAEDAFLEHAGYVGHFYGTPRAYVEEQLAQGKNVLLEIEIQGALQVKKVRDDVLLLFVTAPDADTLRERLIGRGTETPEVVAARLARACEESEGIESYDYLVVNRTVEEAAELTDALIAGRRTGEDCRVCANMEFITRMREQLKKFQKGVKS